MHKINLASGQRPFDSPWVNVDIREQGYPVDVIADITQLPNSINDVEIFVAHHVIEHLDMSVVGNLFKDYFNRLRIGGKLLVAVPDMRAIVDAWTSGRINNYIFNVNTYGAYQGFPTDLHRWSYTEESLMTTADSEWTIKRRIHGLHELQGYDGADLALDWWILMVELVK